MGLGYFKAEVRTGSDALPVSGAEVIIRNSNGIILYELTTDESGNTQQVEFEAPDIEHTLNPADNGPYYSTFDVEINHPSYERVIVNGVQIFDQETSILPVSLVPRENFSSRSQAVTEFNVTPNYLHNPTERIQPNGGLITPYILSDVIIPEYVTVHLGAPSVYAKDVKVKFPDYIKNVASSEIYPTWPEASLEANILCQISFVLNRIYTEWYRSQGYDFDITNSTTVDQYFVEGRNIFENISAIVDRIFNQYIRRVNRKEPFFAEYCNGTSATCPGLSQWGTVTLANQGLNPLQILRYYFPNDIEIVESNIFENLSESYPGTALREGDQSRDVQIMQLYLNRIRQNYPLIPQIRNVNGVYGSDTTAAVRTFQQIFDLTPDGIVGKATWYKISYIYTAVKKLAQLGSEGDFLNVGRTPPTVVIRQGSSGSDVILLQYMLSFIGEFYDEIPEVSQDGNFGSGTQRAVMEFQKLFNLSPDGVVGPSTWNKLYDVYWNIEDIVTIPPDITTPPITTGPEYPGYLIRNGQRGDNVLLMQRYLNAISDVYQSIPKVTEDGIFGNGTQSAVIAFQRQFGLSPDGIIGPATWNKIVEEYNKLGGSSGGGGGGTVTSPAYPGYLIRQGERSENARLVQKYLNGISDTYPSIIKLSEDGIFGANTTTAVRKFQRLMGLSPDGIVGPSTWDALVQEYNRLNSGGTANSTSYPGYLIRQGERSENARLVQRYLNGISSTYPSIIRLTEDGNFGANTTTAVREFQRLMGLSQDGIVGQSTWDALVQEYNRLNGGRNMMQAMSTMLLGRLFLGI